MTASTVTHPRKARHSTHRPVRQAHMPADHATVAGDEALWAARRKRELRLKKRRQAAKDASWFGAPIVDEDGHKHYRGKKKGALARARRQAKHAHLDDHHAPSSTSSDCDLAI